MTFIELYPEATYLFYVLFYLYERITSSKPSNGKQRVVLKLSCPVVGPLKTPLPLHKPGTLSLILPVITGTHRTPRVHVLLPPTSDSQ